MYAPYPLHCEGREIVSDRSSTQVKYLLITYGMSLVGVPQWLSQKINNEMLLKHQAAI